MQLELYAVNFVLRKSQGSFSRKDFHVSFSSFLLTHNLVCVVKSGVLKPDIPDETVHMI